VWLGVCGWLCVWVCESVGVCVCVCVCWWVCESVGVCGWVFVFFLIHLFSLHAPLPCSNTTCIVYKLHVFLYSLYI